ncbi:MAG: HPP family protein [Magnetospirillum sp.]|nr:HPP family protein [Magnetospirillum sp.]
MALAGDAVGATLLMAPMGASAMLIFGVPESPLAQPAHVVGGHLVAALLGLLADHLLPQNLWVMAATAGVAIMVIGLLRLTHPPAGGTALVVMLTHPAWSFLVFPVLSGAMTLVAVAVLIHRLPPRTRYPLPVP